MVFVKQNIFTSGIAYVTMLFDLGHLSFEEIKYVPVLNKFKDKIVFIPRKPSEDDYKWLLKKYKDIRNVYIFFYESFIKR